MKILIIGVGGIGSWLIEEIARAIEIGQISPTVKFEIADNDMVEIKQLYYQNFKDEDIGESKAEILARRFKDYALKPIKKRITEKEQLKGYDLIICCADNNPIREMVFKFCHKNNKDFIDLRAESRYVMVLPKGKSLEADLETLDLKDITDGSCQKESDLERGWIMYGNKIVAMMGIQMLLNYLREQRNNKILIRV